jgi:hypothetical protein
MERREFNMDRIRNYIKYVEKNLPLVYGKKREWTVTECGGRVNCLCNLSNGRNLLFQFDANLGLFPVIKFLDKEFNELSLKIPTKIKNLFTLWLFL